MQIVIYSGDDVNPEECVNKVKERFSIDVHIQQIKFVKLHRHKKMEPQNYPEATIFWQVVAYFEVAAEAMFYTGAPCDIFIDTHGVGFVYPMVKYLFGAKVLSYTHYPTIGSDMIKPNLSFEKKTYYQILM